MFFFLNYRIAINYIRHLQAMLHYPSSPPQSQSSYSPTFGHSSVYYEPSSSPSSSSSNGTSWQMGMIQQNPPINYYFP